ncbi:MAG: DNA recombination protein RmuC [Acutalibacteraceae bacterium]
MQRQNAEKLDEMRGVVDEKLQRTLEERMTQSFRLVNERLEQVYKGLGEMQTLAAGVGDLKKVLSNVKTRGILGESSWAPFCGRSWLRNSMMRMLPPVRAAGSGWNSR